MTPNPHDHRRPATQAAPAHHIATPRPDTTHPQHRQRRRPAFLWLTPALGVTTYAWAATVNLPVRARWVLAATAITGGACLLLAPLLTLTTRRLAARSRPRTGAGARPATWPCVITQTAGLVLVVCVAVTALNLHILRQARQDLTRHGQPADRYIAAVDQLGSGNIQVRLGGIYALEALARESPGDHQIVYDVLAAHVRASSPAARAGEPSARLAADVQAALTVIGRRDHARDVRPVDLSGIRAPGARLAGMSWGAVNLRGADLRGADLRGADLRHADLTGADLRGADLREVKGWTAERIRHVAVTDDATLMSPA